MSQPNKEITIVEPKQIFQILSKPYPYPKFTKKGNVEIKRQFKRFKVDSDGRMVEAIGEPIKDEEKEVAGIREFIKKIDKVIEDLEKLKQLLNEKIR
jgi:hypothetical protein